MLTPETLWVAPWFFHYSDDICWIQNKTSELQVDDECGAETLRAKVLCALPSQSQSETSAHRLKGGEGEKAYSI